MPKTIPRMMPKSIMTAFFFFNDTATTEIYTLSLHDALPICGRGQKVQGCQVGLLQRAALQVVDQQRSEEHTSELQSHLNLVCRLLLEKKLGITDVGLCRGNATRCLRWRMRQDGLGGSYIFLF